MTPLLSVCNVSKRYGSVQALDDVNLEVRAGEVHAVLGENGAGKSTLMGVLAGFLVPDTGEYVLDGKSTTFGDPVHLRHLGVEMVHQHFLLVPNFRVEENLVLARATKLNSPIDFKKATGGALQKAEELGWKVDGKSVTSELPVGVQQRIEILKALAGDARILILDEPTAVLSPEEVEDLMSVLRRLRDSGVAIVLIAHKLSEVVGIADRVTVLRKGKLVASAMMSETNTDQLAEWMVGERLEPTTFAVQPVAKSVLKVSDLFVKGDRGELAVRGLSFEIYEGEIYGIGGVDGNGQLELAEALAGVRKPNGGTLAWSTGRRPTTGYIPQDRQTDGLALTMSIMDNMMVAGLDGSDLTVGPFLKPRMLRGWASSLVSKFEIKTPSASLLASSLSGGNQQKVVVARTLARRPDFLVAANPTRGLDIRATAYVHEQILKAAFEGTAVVLVSTDTDELDALAHRQVFLSRGQFTDRIVGGDA